MAEAVTLDKNLFKEFASKDGCTSSDVTRWFKSASLFGKLCTSNSLDIAFSKVKSKGAKVVNYDQCVDLVKEMSASYKKDHPKCDDAVNEMITKLNAASSKAKGTTTSKAGGVDRLTDTSKYTGSHKERFDADGKGKGAAGRSDAVENTGYVGNYKGAGTYDKK